MTVCSCWFGGLVQSWSLPGYVHSSLLICGAPPAVQLSAQSTALLLHDWPHHEKRSNVDLGYTCLPRNPAPPRSTLAANVRSFAR